MAKIGGCKKEGRSQKKKAARNLPFSRFVRGVISAETYFKLTGQKTK